MRQERLLDHVLPASAFYPIPFEHWSALVTPDPSTATTRLCADAKAVHLWHEMMRRHGFDKRRLPPKDSFWGQAVQKRGAAHFFLNAAS
jgi:hypothetical protein